MKKWFFIFFISSNFLSLFSIETVITPSISYTNYFLHTVYIHKKSSIHLHTGSLGLDLMFIGEKQVLHSLQIIIFRLWTKLKFLEMSIL